MKVDKKVNTNVSPLDSAQIDKISIKGKKDQGKTTGVTDLGASEASRVNLSQRSQDMKRIKELATKAPEVDAEKVSRLQKLIDEGKYKIDSKAIADKMVDEQLNMGE